MMNSKNLYYKVVKGALTGSVEVPSSKSHANRALVLAALSTEDILLTNIPPSTDVHTMLECFEKIGLLVEKKENSVWIKGSFPECEKDIDSPLTLFTGDGGTTNRFLIPLLALGEREYLIEPTGHMKNRPMEVLFDVLKELEVKVSRNDGVWAKIKGPICKDLDVVEVDGSVSSQFASGIYLALSKYDMKVEVVHIDGSESYFLLTCQIIDYFKDIKKNQNKYNIPVDFSSISYPIAQSLFSSGIEVTNCFEIDRFQPDSAFLDIIKKMGGDYHFEKGHLTIVKPDSINALDLDCKEFPDLVPTLAFCFSYARGETVFRNLRSLRVKECDRINEVMKILKLFKIRHKLDQNDNLTIIGGSLPSVKVPIDIHPEEDHRMVMLSYLFLRINAGGKLYNYKCVDKSFSNFYSVME